MEPESIPMKVLSLIPLLHDLLALSHVTISSQLQNLPASAAGRTTVESHNHTNQQGRREMALGKKTEALGSE